MKKPRGKKIILSITVGYGDEGQEILDEIKKRAGANKRGAGTALADYVLERIFKKDLPMISLGRPMQTTEGKVRIMNGGMTRPEEKGRSISYDVDENTDDPMPRIADVSEIPAGKPK